jgi:hypothetical protein
MYTPAQLSIIAHVEKCLELMGKASYELDEATADDFPNSHQIRVTLDATIKQAATLLDDLYSLYD